MIALAGHTRILGQIINNNYTRIQFNLGFSKNIGEWYEIFR